MSSPPEGSCLHHKQSVHRIIPVRSYSFTGALALRHWGDGSLGFNVIDSASTQGFGGLVPPELEAVARGSAVAQEHWLAYVLSLPRAGEMHVDPPHGSGWQRLVVGRKRWIMVDPATFEMNNYRPGFGAGNDDRDTLDMQARFLCHPLQHPAWLTLTSSSLGRRSLATRPPSQQTLGLGISYAALSAGRMQFARLSLRSGCRAMLPEGKWMSVIDQGDRNPRIVFLIHSSIDIVLVFSNLLSGARRPRGAIACWWCAELPRVCCAIALVVRCLCYIYCS